MPIISFNFTKIHVERNEIPKGSVNIKSNLNITNVKEESIAVSKEKQPLANIDFEFIVDYSPEIGKVLLNGSLLYTHEAKKIKKFIDDWSKKKDVDKEILEAVINTALSRCSIRALGLEQEIGLPSHIHLPRVSAETRLETRAKDYIG